ncbi:MULTISPECIES: class F sortase [unclassified Arthrobacter]|uniref:class F sortase n=1 Tax=unclassified Arthrobacter TaxID=235627 RepID=UPI001D134FC2|nr:MULTISPECIES: class F sortase [unclassified Arthrobacter]MCC3275031.1 class F sortase [Arthrobacter sp. zg-Y20]MCC9177372.1 class F sortase [Arthrobacter sp. zg-Y750]MDK1315188.1 class F sortase [Arthrobacter sp. zg.Y20]WIB05026.1 class F sortase [Arthrobacter sp. zg-Y20]
MPSAPLRRLAAAVFLSAAVAGTAACGGSQPPSAGPDASVTAAPGASSPAPSAAAEPVPIRQATPTPAEEIPDPVGISVDGTGIELEVIPVGQEPNGAMTLPNNHYQAGWYRFGPAPGSSRGAAVLAAHVDSRTEQLPIAGLDEVPAGTPLTVTRSDGSVLRYTTQEVKNIPKASLDQFDLFDRGGAPRLELVTCGGKWLDSVGDYEDNVVLTAVPVP